LHAFTTMPEKCDFYHVITFSGCDTCKWSTICIHELVLSKTVVNVSVVMLSTEIILPFVVVPQLPPYQIRRLKQEI